MEMENDAMLCGSCAEPVDVADKHASFQDFTWHEDCFVCSSCTANLVNVLFVLNNDNCLFCNKCFDDKYGVTCLSCQKIIKLGDEKFKLGEAVWHRNCFQCQHCQETLHPNSFWMHEKLNYCKNCYGDLFTKTCERCNEKIWKNGIKFRDNNLHNQCFVCNVCELELSDKRFFYKNDLLFCEKCHCENFCKTCENCKEFITGLDGEKMITSNNENWHNKCFFCNNCKESLVGMSFIGKGNKIFCAGCSQ